MDGVDVIVQTLPLDDTRISIWYKTNIEVAGVQYGCVCTGEGEKRAVHREVGM